MLVLWTDRPFSLWEGEGGGGGGSSTEITLIDYIYTNRTSATITAAGQIAKWSKVTCLVVRVGRSASCYPWPIVHTATGSPL